MCPLLRQAAAMAPTDNLKAAWRAAVSNHVIRDTLFVMDSSWRDVAA